jgi:hypothetical protein
MEEIITVIMIRTTGPLSGSSMVWTGVTDEVAARAADVLGPAGAELAMDDGNVAGVMMARPDVRHAGPGCACGINEIGQSYVDPICRPR